MTYLEKFKKDKPKAPMTRSGIPFSCPCHYYDAPHCVGCDGMTCIECWGKEMEVEHE